MLARRRELVDSASKIKVADVFYDDKHWVHVSQEELLQGINIFSGHEVHQISDLDFRRQIFLVPNMDISVICANTLSTAGSAK